MLVGETSCQINLLDVYPARSEIVGSTCGDLHARLQCLHKASPRAALGHLLDVYMRDDQDTHTKHRHIDDQAQYAGNSDLRSPASFSGHPALKLEEPF